MHHWTKTEIEELLRAAVFDEDLWSYCTACGQEISPVEPDVEWAWCGHCGCRVQVEGLRFLGLI